MRRGRRRLVGVRRHHRRRRPCCSACGRPRCSGVRSSRIPLPVIGPCDVPTDRCNMGRWHGSVSVSFWSGVVDCHWFVLNVARLGPLAGWVRGLLGKFAAVATCSDRSPRRGGPVLHPRATSHLSSPSIVVVPPVDGSCNEMCVSGHVRGSQRRCAFLRGLGASSWLNSSIDRWPALTKFTITSGVRRPSRR